MVRIFLILSFVLSGFVLDDTSEALEIENFKSGLVCPYKSDFNSQQKTSGWICFETESVYITGQSKCTYDGNERPCTWYGFEFDYDEIDTDQELTCVSKFSETKDIGNPHGIIAEDADFTEYSLTLKANSSHYYNPQYSLFVPIADHEKTVIDETVCSLGSKEMFRFKFQLIYPKLITNKN